MPGKMAKISKAALNSSQKIVSSIWTFAWRTRRRMYHAVTRLPKIRQMRISVWSNILQAPFGIRGRGVALAEPLDQQDGDGHFDHILHAAPERQVALAGGALAHFHLHFFDFGAVFDQVADGVRLGTVVQVLGKLLHQAAVEHPHAAGGVADGAAGGEPDGPADDVAAQHAQGLGLFHGQEPAADDDVVALLQVSLNTFPCASINSLTATT